MEKIWILTVPVIAILFSTISISNIYSEDPESLSQMSIDEAQNGTSVETSTNDTFAPSETPESLSQMS
ncbi:MAG: hypothetical protein ACE5SW_07770, partial [Nitrososphaeraceae archaeon]